MGKSPGKWIKTVLFGKKSSKSHFSKDIAIEEKASVTAKVPSGDLAVNPPVIPHLPHQTTDTRAEKTELEKGATSSLPCGSVVLLPGTQGEVEKGTTSSNSANNDELTRQEQAATKAQAAFRGYLPMDSVIVDLRQILNDTFTEKFSRAFWALKGIIRLQALVRGHLVRRQAVATLRCMQSIVKFQALVRGRRVRLSDAGLEVLKKYTGRELPDVKPVDFLGVNTFLISEKLSTNAFVSKLLASLPTAVPMSLQYDLVELNSVWNWLERWSSSRFWEPLARQKKILNVKPKRKQANTQTEEMEAGRPKRGVRKVPAKSGNNNLLHSSEHEKPKRKPRKVLGHQAELVQEQPQIELEKVKRNLRKVSVSDTIASDKSETITEKPHHNPIEVSSSPTPEVSGQGMYHTSEKLSDSTVAVSKQPVAETPSKPLVVDKPLDDHPAVELHSLENSGKVESTPTVNEELSSKEDQTTKENQRTRRRSFPAKQEYPENVSQNVPTLPSYMAATESAKAKLRAQESPRFGEDGAENGFIRRHSLPSFTNGKSSSPSPRMQKSIQANGKGGSKSNMSLTSSRDEKVLQTGWRR